VTYVLEGTWDEIKAHEAEFNGYRLRVIVETDEPDWTDIIPDPPFTVSSREQLVEALTNASPSGSGIELTPEFWARKKAEMLARLEGAH
jgi:hypothetical protein